MNIISISAICLIACTVCKILDRNASELKIALPLAVICITFFKIMGELSGIKEVMNELMLRADADSEYINIIFKGLGICYITQISMDICRDCGENALSTVVETTGKIAMTVISMPLFKAIIEIIEELLD